MLRTNISKPSPMICPQRWASDSAMLFAGLSSNPQVPFAQWDAVFSILPFDIPVAEFFKRPRIESSGPRQFAEPLDDRHIDAIGGGIADDEANFRRRCANTA